MLQAIQKTTSLARISKRNFCGQVATILILMMVAVLIFVLAIINLGKISLTTTTLSNAADSAALGLGSQLGTKANSLWHALGEKTEKCKKGGWLVTILGIVFAIVAVVLAIVFPPSTGVTAPLLIGVGAGAGMIGGIVGAVVQGTNILTGALQGAIIGAAIGAGAAAGAGAGAGLEGVVPGATPGTYLVGGVVITAKTAAEAALIAGAAGGAVTGVAIGVAVGITLAAGSAIYNKSVADKMSSAAFAAAAKALSGLPDYYQYQEGVVLQAFSQTVDDPNMETDSVDTDTDGDLNEEVSAFQVWWYNRTSQYEPIVNLMKSHTATFKTALKYTVHTSGPFGISWSSGYGILPFDSFYRDEVEGADGSVIEVLRSLEDAVAGGVSFWDPGPTESQINNWIASCDACEACEECPTAPPAGYDLTDDMMIALQNFSDYAQAILDQDTSGLVSSYNSWIKNFYDPDEQGDYYGQLQEIKSGLTKWSLEIESLRTKLPKCVKGLVLSPDYSNPPCQKDSFGTIDEDSDDEFSAAQADINSAIKRINTVLSAILNYYNKMEAAGASLLGGMNPATYSWTDSIGAHSVKVSVGDFTVPYIKTKKSGSLVSKICLILKNYSGSVSVSITKTDPSDVNIGVLGAWNRSAGTITRRSTVSYNGVCSGECVRVTGK